jgi:hypothetical protein
VGQEKAVHAFTDFDIDVVMVDKWYKVIFDHDGFRENGDGEAHIFKFVHG